MEKQAYISRQMSFGQSDSNVFNEDADPAFVKELEQMKLKLERTLQAEDQKTLQLSQIRR